MKKILGILSGIAFITLITLATANAQEPEKKATETKAKTEQCSKEKSKCCPNSCDKKAKEETKNSDEKKVEKK